MPLSGEWVIISPSQILCVYIIAWIFQQQNTKRKPIYLGSPMHVSLKSSQTIRLITGSRMLQRIGAKPTDLSIQDFSREQNHR